MLHRKPKQSTTRASFTASPLYLLVFDTRLRAFVWVEGFDRALVGDALSEWICLEVRLDMLTLVVEYKALC